MRNIKKLIRELIQVVSLIIIEISDKVESKTLLVKNQP